QKLHAFEQGTDAARAFVWHGLKALQRERGLLVLGADAELGRRLAARLEPRDEFVTRLQRRHIDLVTRHEKIRITGDSTERALWPTECGRRRPQQRNVSGESSRRHALDGGRHPDARPGAS